MEVGGFLRGEQVLIEADVGSSTFVREPSAWRLTQQDGCEVQVRCISRLDLSASPLNLNSLALSSFPLFSLVVLCSPSLPNFPAASSTRPSLSALRHFFVIQPSRRDLDWFHRGRASLASRFRGIRWRRRSPSTSVLYSGNFGRTKSPSPARKGKALAYRT